MEHHVAAGHTREENRYAGLVQECTKKGWFARAVLLWKLVALVMFRYPCFTAQNPLG